MVSGTIFFFFGDKWCQEPFSSSSGGRGGAGSSRGRTGGAMSPLTNLPQLGLCGVPDLEHQAIAEALGEAGGVN
jgi:hypothetical protein